MSDPSRKEPAFHAPPAPTITERFRNDVHRLIARAFDGARATDQLELALAVSGGPDSMAMLALAAAAFPGRVSAATFDHRLRAGSAEEAAMVADACQTLGVPHTTLSPDAAIEGSSLQRLAREARYSALIAWAANHDIYPLLTAHHADDQAETLLMRLNRSSGLSGLSAIRPYLFADGALILRPLLTWRCAELRAIVEASGLPFVDDPSNRDPRHDRTHVRALLAATPMLDPVALASSAAYLAEAEDVLDRQTELLWTERWRGGARGLALDDLPRELRRRLVRRALAAIRAALVITLPPFDDSANVEALLDAIEAGRAATQAGILVRPHPTGCRFSAAPPRRSP